MEQFKKPDQNIKKPQMHKKLTKAKPSFPAVRQTLTSYKRMLKANPLLEYEAAGIDIDNIIAQKSSTSLKCLSLKGDLNFSKTSTSDIKKPDSMPGKSLTRTQSLRLPKANNGTKPPLSKKSSGINPDASNNNTKPSIYNANNLKPELQRKTEAADLSDKGNKISTKPVIKNIKAKVNSFPKGVAPKPKQTITNQKSKSSSSSLRRSLSTGHLETKRGKSFDPKQVYKKLNQSQSQEQLCAPVPNDFKDFSPIREETENFVFKTPSAYNRRSICHYTPRTNRKSLFRASTPAPLVMQKLQERLNKWLKSRGKPPASFSHLKMFGSKPANISPPPANVQVSDDENKENIEVIEARNQSYEDLKITITPDIDQQENAIIDPCNEMANEDLIKYAKEAMTELIKLIEEDYPRDQCLGWLEIIREKYNNIDNEPEYWECRAAIEQSAGNVHNAVEFYKTAIIQGAEVNTVDKSLDQLLKKFSLLNISPQKADAQKNCRGEKERIVREARNVFKSSIIQFAIRERNIKKTQIEIPTAKDTSGKKLLVVPVRRSTRLSRSGYINTSGVKLCNSIKDIDLSSEDISFEKNKALIPY